MVEAVIQIVPVLLCVVIPAIVLHEYAHGFMANRLGDPTAKQLGRLTLNPLSHIDPVGTIIVPGALYLVYALGWTHSLLVFGWAKPVPVNFSRLNNPKRDMLWVGLAGPLINIAIAFLVGQVLICFDFSSFWPDPFSLFVRDLLNSAVLFNVGLAVFNMLPIPPLDGSRVVAGLIPSTWEKMYYSLEPFGFVIVIVLLNAGLLDFLHPLIYRTANLMGLQ
jgi:Zn-dependent protease